MQAKEPNRNIEAPIWGDMQTLSSKLLMAAILAAAAIGCRPNVKPASEQPGAIQAEATPVQSSGADSLNADSAPDDLRALAESLQRLFAQPGREEAARMLYAITHGRRMALGEGWFGPGQSRYSWHWLIDAHHPNNAKGIIKDQFRGKPRWFERLDRDRDGQIVEADLDWSEASSYVQGYYFMNDILGRIDRQKDGLLSREEWLSLFERAAGQQAHATTVDLTELLLVAQAAGGSPAENMLNPADLLGALSRGDLGSPNEGPDLNSPAPDFELKTQDDKQTMRLSDFRGSKPVVLVFGNYTCDPFRARYALVDDLNRRYQDDAAFLAIYVREAHPSDGWRTLANDRARIEIAQPRSYQERTAAAQSCQAALNCSMPLLVDTIDDEVSNLYSGAPMRLYVIDREGKVAYKGGRGPIGFRTAELEQALLLTLIDEHLRN